MADVSSEHLKRIPIFRELDLPALRALAALARTRSLVPRDVIVQEGEPARGLQVILAGRANVSMTTSDGRSTTIGELGPGEVIGEISLIDGGMPSATVTALAPGQVICIDREPFLELLEREPRVCLGLLSVLAARLRRLTRWADDLAGLPLGARLAKCLIALLAQHGQQTGPQRHRLALKISQHDLASRIGVSRESVNKHLRRLERAGALTHEAGYMVITDLAQLRSAAEGS